MNKQDRAASLLSGYFKLVFERAGLQWNGDNQAEIEDLINLLWESRQPEAQQPAPTAAAPTDLLQQAISAWRKAETTFGSVEDAENEWTIRDDARTLALLSLAQSAHKITELLADLNSATVQNASTNIDDHCKQCGNSAAAAGHARWTTCSVCQQPVCDICAIQAFDGHFCTECMNAVATLQTRHLARSANQE